MNKVLLQNFLNYEERTNAIKKERQQLIEALAARPQEELELLREIMDLSSAANIHTDETLAFGHRLLKLDKEEDSVADTYDFMARIYKSRQETAKAKECYYKSIWAMPWGYEAILELAAIYEDENDIERALETYEFFDNPERENGREEMYRYKGCLYGNLENWQKAVEFLNKAILCSTEYKLLMEMKKQPADPKTFKTYKEELITNPENMEAHFNLGSLYQRNDYYMAMHHYTEALKLNADIPEAYFNMAILALENGGTMDECETFLIKAMAGLESKKTGLDGDTTCIDWVLTLVYLNLGSIYEKTGALEKAARFKYRYIRYKDLVVSDPHDGRDFI